MEPTAPPEVAPLDVDGVRAVALGTVLWAVALLVTLALRGPLNDAGNGWWTWVCASGLMLGLMGLVYVVRRRDSIRRTTPPA